MFVVVSLPWFINRVKLLFTNQTSRAQAPVNEALIWRLIKINALCKANLLVFVIEYGVIVSEEIETKDPVWLMRTMHELDNTLVVFRSTLKPLITVDSVLNSIDGEVDVRDALVLLSGTITHSQSIFESLALEFISKKVIVYF